MSEECDGLKAQITALAKLVDEREAWTKERFTAMEKNVNSALAAADKAVSKAELATEKRFESVNEFGRTFRELATTYMPKSEYTVQHEALVDRVVALETTSRGRKEGLSLLGQILLAGITGAGIVVTAGIAFFRH